MKHNDNEIYMNFKVRSSKKGGQSPLYVRLTFTGKDNAINTGINVNKPHGIDLVLSVTLSRWKVSKPKLSL